MGEAEYYETAADWSLERHLENEDQLMRLQATAAMISPSCERLLDVGTGNGAFLSFLEQRSTGLALHGLERSKSAIAASRCRATIAEGSVNALPFDDCSYDTVTALEVIEHLPFPVYSKALSEMARVARSQVLISVPYRERRLMITCPECSCRFSPIFHLRTFDERSLPSLVPGFELDRTELVTTEVHWLLTEIATRVRTLRDRLRGEIPVRTACPQCDLAMGPPAPTSAAACSGSHPRRRGLRSTVLSWMPKVQRAHWIVASYRRIHT